MRSRHDLRARVLVLTGLCIAVLGLIFAWPWSGMGVNGDAAILSPTSDLSLQETREGDAKLDPDFLEAVTALSSGNHSTAVRAGLKFLERAPHVPEAHVNLGFAYLGTNQLSAAENAFEQALQLRPQQANAYYGLGMVYEKRGNLGLARSAMRTFIHLTDDNDPFLPKARAALWEWEAE